MKTSVLVFAILAAAISTSAVAKDVNQGKKAPTSTVAATPMTDSEMDKVTAGELSVAPPVSLPGAACNNSPVLCGGSISTGGAPNFHAFSPGRGTGAAHFLLD
jgi:hypothetical protein